MNENIQLPRLEGRESRLYGWNKFVSTIEEQEYADSPGRKMQDGTAWAWSIHAQYILVPVSSEALASWKRQNLSTRGIEGMIYEDHPEFAAIVKSFDFVPWVK